MYLLDQALRYVGAFGKVCYRLLLRSIYSFSGNRRDVVEVNMVFKRSAKLYVTVSDKKGYLDQTMVPVVDSLQGLCL